MAIKRVREVKNRDEMAKLVDDFLTTGMVIKEQGANSTLMQDHTWGSGAGWAVSLILALVLSWTVIGLFIPVFYAIYAHYTAPKTLIRVGSAPEATVGI
jgi:hypothetical protein